MADGKAESGGPVGGARRGLTQSEGWRSVLRSVAPALSPLPPSLHTVQLLASRGFPAEAEAALHEIVRTQPRSIPALRYLAELYRRSNRRTGAAAVLRRLHEIELDAAGLSDMERAELLQFRLAAEGLADAPDVAPAAHVAALFDRYADRFDELLTDSLRYRGPEVVRDAALAHLALPDELAVLDLGCGTGLAAPHFRPIAARLDGVDLSSEMVARARARGLYDHLEIGEIVDFLSRTPSTYDLIVAVDVFVYFGALDDVLAGCSRVLRRGGRIVFTVEAHADSDQHGLRPTGRYAHGATYVRRAARAAELDVLSVEETVVRYESLAPVRSYVCVLEASA